MQKAAKSSWNFDPKVNRAHARTICCDVVNRGVALYHGKVYLGTLDGRLIALDAKSGHPVWEVLTADQSHPYAITGAPRIAKGMVLIGNAGGEFGVRGYLSAYDAESGKLLWRTYTVPGDAAGEARVRSAGEGSENLARQVVGCGRWRHAVGLNRL